MGRHIYYLQIGTFLPFAKLCDTGFPMKINCKNHAAPVGYLSRLVFFFPQSGNSDPTQGLWVRAVDVHMYTVDDSVLCVMGTAVCLSVP